MSSTNPFAPPQAHVSDVSAEAQEFQPVRILSVSGRIGRVRYLAYFTGAWFLLSILFAIVGVAGPSRSWFAFAAICAINLVFLIQRSHDMDLSGWFSLLAFIPFVGLFWLFKAGTPGPNTYGAPPVPNTLGVKILAWVFPGIVVIGILAAIAIPAYSSYVLRAKAAQVK
jgi:uncharacterized membrane protein YhaH (DUF805 family)